MRQVVAAVLLLLAAGCARRQAPPKAPPPPAEAEEAAAHEWPGRDLVEHAGPARRAELADAWAAYRRRLAGAAKVPLDLVASAMGPVPRADERMWWRERHPGFGQDPASPVALGFRRVAQWRVEVWRHRMYYFVEPPGGGTTASAAAPLGNLPDEALPFELPWCEVMHPTEREPREHYEFPSADRAAHWLARAMAAEVPVPEWQRLVYARIACGWRVPDGGSPAWTGLVQGIEAIHRRLEPALGKPQTDPWLAAMWRGHYHLLRLQSAGRVSDRDLTGIAAPTIKHDGAAAYGAFAAAHRLHPSWPEAATALIAVVDAGHAGTAGETPRTWFDQAIAAEVDWAPAYEAFCGAMGRRYWGEESAGLREFADLCIWSELWDTPAPDCYAWLVSAEWRSERDAPPDVMPRLSGLFWERAERYPDRRDLYLSLLAGAEWRTGNVKKAAQLLEELGDRALPIATAWFAAAPFERIANESLLSAGRYATAVAELEQAMNDGRAAEVIRDSRAVLGEKPPRAVAEAVRTLLRTAELAAAGRAAEPVALDFPEGAGWRAVEEAEQFALGAAGSDTRALRLHFGPNCRLVGRITAAPGRRRGPELRLGWRRRGRYYNISVAVNANAAPGHQVAVASAVPDTVFPGGLALSPPTSSGALPPPPGWRPPSGEPGSGPVAAEVEFRLIDDEPWIRINGRPPDPPLPARLQPRQDMVNPGLTVIAGLDRDGSARLAEWTFEYRTNEPPPEPATAP